MTHESWQYELNFLNNFNFNTLDIGKILQFVFFIPPGAIAVREVFKKLPKYSHAVFLKNIMKYDRTIWYYDAIKKIIFKNRKNACAEIGKHIGSDSNSKRLRYKEKHNLIKIKCKNITTCSLYFHLSGVSVNNTVGNAVVRKSQRQHVSSTVFFL